MSFTFITSRLLAVLLLGLMSLGSSLATSPPIEIVTLTASPSVVVDNVTTELTVDCRGLPELAKGLVLASITRTNENGTTALVVSQWKISGDLDDDRVTVTAGTEDEWRYIAVTIKNPTFGDHGTYTCLVLHFSDDFKVLLTDKSVNVTVEEKPEVEVPQLMEEEVEVVNVTACHCGDVWDEINSLKETLVAENKMLKQKFQEYNESRLLENQLLKEELQKHSESCRVSFSAKLTSDAPLKSGSSARFGDVISNMGEAFNPDDSVFVAPCEGQYFFSLTLRSQQKMDSGYVEGVVLVDGEALVKTFVFIGEAISNYQTATNGAVVTLTQGQEVRVKVMTTSAGKLKSSAYSVFSGFYLYP